MNSRLSTSVRSIIMINIPAHIRYCPRSIFLSSWILGDDPRSMKDVRQSKMDSTERNSNVPLAAFIAIKQSVNTNSCSTITLQTLFAADFIRESPATAKSPGAPGYRIPGSQRMVLYRSDWVTLLSADFTQRIADVIRARSRPRPRLRSGRSPRRPGSSARPCR